MKVFRIFTKETKGFIVYTTNKNKLLKGKPINSIEKIEVKRKFINVYLNEQKKPLILKNSRSLLRILEYVKNQIPTLDKFKGYMPLEEALMLTGINKQKFLQKADMLQLGMLDEDEKLWFNKWDIEKIKNTINNPVPQGYLTTEEYAKKYDKSKGEVIYLIRNRFVDTIRNKTKTRIYVKDQICEAVFPILKIPELIYKIEGERLITTQTSVKIFKQADKTVVVKLINDNKSFKIKSIGDLKICHTKSKSHFTAKINGKDIFCMYDSLYINELIQKTYNYVNSEHPKLTPEEFANSKGIRLIQVKEMFPDKNFFDTEDLLIDIEKEWYNLTELNKILGLGYRFIKENLECKEYFSKKYYKFNKKMIK